MRHPLNHPLIRMNQGVVCLCVEGQVVMPRASGDSPVDTIAGEVYLALEDCYMTTAEQGRRRHAPRSGVVARRFKIKRGRHARAAGYVARRYSNRRGRHAPRSGVRCPQMQFHTMTPAEHPSVDDGVIERGFFAYRLAGVQMMGMGSSLCEDSAVECDADDAPWSIINRFKNPPRIQP